MINTYFVGMTIISWVVAIFMIFGCLAIQLIKIEANGEKTDEIERLKSEAFINAFYSKDLLGKVVAVLHYGAIICATMFKEITKLFKIKGKGDNK